MANWIIDQEGDALNLDRITSLIIHEECSAWAVHAYISIDDLYDYSKCYVLQDFDSEEGAKDYIKKIVNKEYLYKSEAHRLAEVLA